MSDPKRRPESVAARIQREADEAMAGDSAADLDRDWLYGWQADFLARVEATLRRPLGPLGPPGRPW